MEDTSPILVTCGMLRKDPGADPGAPGTSRETRVCVARWRRTVVEMHTTRREMSVTATVTRDFDDLHHAQIFPSLWGGGRGEISPPPSLTQIPVRPWIQLFEQNSHRHRRRSRSHGMRHASRLCDVLRRRRTRRRDACRLQCEPGLTARILWVAHTHARTPTAHFDNTNNDVTH